MSFDTYDTDNPTARAREARMASMRINQKPQLSTESWVKEENESGNQPPKPPRQKITQSPRIPRPKNTPIAPPAIPTPVPIVLIEKDSDFMARLQQEFDKHINILKAGASSIDKTALDAMICDINEDYRIITMLINNETQLKDLVTGKQQAYETLHEQMHDRILVPFVPSNSLFSTASSLAERLKL